jgi:hypothetical protein
MEGPWTITGTIIGAMVLLLTGWQIVVNPIWRQWRLKKPCKAWFVIQSLNHENMSYAVQDDKEHFIEELTLPANSEAEIEVIYIYRIYRLFRLSFQKYSLAAANKILLILT